MMARVQFYKFVEKKNNFTNFGAQYGDTGIIKASFLLFFFF